jgi:hypothetical protein
VVLIEGDRIDLRLPSRTLAVQTVGSTGEPDVEECNHVF